MSRSRKRNQNNCIADKPATVYYLARRYFPHLWRYHRDEVRAVASAADFLFPGPRVRFGEFCRVIQRRLYWTSRELGWRRTRDGRWIKEFPIG